MRLRFTWQNSARGALIYTVGDSIAALILGEWSLTRCLGLALVGACLYALEIPNYFQWIDRTIAGKTGWLAAVQRTALAIAYFNPLWIARHLLFIRLFSGQYDQISWGLLQTGAYAFLANIPLSLLGNYVIQNVVRLPWRFTASAIFSALMAIYYALSAVLFP